MQNWTIYSIGDSEFLEQILISLVMVTGSDDFMKAASISALLSVIFIGFSSMMNKGREFDLSSVLVGWILFSIMFIPRSTVLIEDTVDGSVRVVDNVPLGVAASGGIISQLGYGLTNLFEQAYSHTSSNMGEGYFAESLVILNSIRTKAFNAEVFKMMDETTGWKMYDSFYNYMKDCTAKGQFTGNNRNQAMAENFFTFMHNNSTLFHTEIYPNGQRTQVTCNEAYSLIMTALNAGLASPKVQNAINDTSGFKDRLLVGATNEMGQPYSLMSNVQNSLNMLTAGATTAQDYVKLSILEPIYMNALQGYYMNMQDTTSAVMLNQAIQQRNTQWAAEQSMFMTSLRPLVAFFEAFIFAILPILGVMLIAGRFGFSLAGKYLMVLIWVQLWFPLLSIVNLFITVAATREMRQFTDGLTSVFALNKSTDILQNWIGVGGMLAGYTPVLALFVIGGSVFTLNSIASKISGSDNVNEKMVSPDLTNGPSLMENQSRYQNSQASGTIHSGAESAIGTINIGNSLQESSQLSKQKSDTASSNFMHGMGRAFSNTSTWSEQSAILNSIGSQIMSSQDDRFGMIQKQAMDIGKTHSLDQSQTHAVSGALALGASGQVSSSAATGIISKIIGGKGGNDGKGVNETSSKTDSNGLRVDAGLKNTNTDTTQSSKSIQDATKLMESLSGDKGFVTALSSSLADKFDESHSETFNNAIGDSNTENLSKMASAVLASSKTYAETDANSSSFGSSFAIKSNTFSQAIQKSPEAIQKMENLLDAQPSAVRSQIANRERALINHGGMHRQDAKYAAMGEVLTNKNTFNGNAQDYINSVNSIAEAFQTASGVPAGQYSNPSTEGNTISPPGFDGSTVRNQVNNGTSNGGHLFNDGSVSSYVNEQLAQSGDGRRNSHNASSPTVMAKDQDNRQNVAQRYQNAKQEEANKQLSNVYQGYVATDVSITEADRFWGVNERLVDGLSDTFNNTKTQLTNAVDQVGTLLDKGWSAAEEGYNTAQSQSNIYQQRDQQRTSLAKSWGLTDNQAQYYSSLMPNSTLDSTKLREAVVNEFGSSDLEKSVGNKTAQWIEEAQYAGKNGGAYLAPVTKINDIKKWSNNHKDFFGKASSTNPEAFMSMPVEDAKISSKFDPERMHPIEGVIKPHNGTDFSAPTGTPITAAMSGTVSFNGYQKGYGNIMIIDHGNGSETRYAHNSWNNPDLKVGSQVNEGDLIAKVGSTGASTGPHLHFEARQDGVPYDPTPYLAKK